MDRNAIVRLIVIAGIILVDLIPVMISLLMLWPKKQDAKAWKHVVITGLCLGIHVCNYILIQKLVIRYWDKLQFVRRAVLLDFTDLDISYFAVFFSIESIAAGAVSCCILLLLSFFLRKNANVRGILQYSRRRAATLYLIVSVVGIFVAGTLFYSFSAARNVVINEIGSNNISIPLNQYGTFFDYIELYNQGDLPCAAEQLYLSDDEYDLKKKALPKTVIPAKGYLLVKLDEYSFGLNRNGGETVYLSDALGFIIDQVSTVAVEPDFSYCRVDDISDDWRMYSATPGETNKKGFARLHTAPQLSHESGFYDDAFDLQIMAEEGITIHYTLDGSIPTSESEIYTQPIRVYDRSEEPNIWRSQQRVQENWANYTPDTTPVDKAFIIRAVGIDAEGSVSVPVTATYFVGLEEYKDYNVISLVVDPEDFWGENGIYVTGNEYDIWYTGEKREGVPPIANFLKRGRVVERPAHFTFLSEGEISEENIGVRVTGASSRINPQKRFSIFAREIYNNSDTFKMDFFKDVQSKSLSLRYGFAGAFCQGIAQDRNFGIQRAKRAFVFLNGEYWYDYNIMERYDKQYFYEHYGVNPNNVVVVKSGGLQEGVRGDELLLNDIYDYLAVHDLSDSKNYAGFAEIVDIQSYIDYMCFNIYIDNMDFTEQKNAAWWRSRAVTSKPYEDGKWRFLLYDLDAMEWNDSHLWGVNSQAEKNTFSLTPRFTGNQAINQQPIFVALKKNPEFVKRFASTFMDMVNVHFQYDNVKRTLDEYIQSGKRKSSAEYYEVFFKERANYIVPYMAEEFSLAGTLETLRLGTNDHAAGYIQLNTITPDLSRGDWSGQYYTDFPVAVTAVAREGYVFKGWTGSVHSEEASLEVNLSTGGMSLYAIFEKEAS